MRPAVFLDRDGTIIEERGYLDRLDLLELYSFTADAIRLLNRAGYATVVVTNQGGIGRGIIDEAFLRHVHETIDARLAAGRATIERYYFCPHHPDAVVPELRVSREAPVLILEYDSTEVVPGGAGNAANNVAAMGGSALLAAVIGRDEAGRRMLKSLHKRVNPRTVVRSPRRGTTIKTRILAGGIHSAKQQVVRIDHLGGGSVDKTSRDG